MIYWCFANLVYFSYQQTISNCSVDVLYKSFSLHQCKTTSRSSVSNSGQNFKTQVSGSWKKPCENPFCLVLKWMRFWVLKTHYHC